MSELKCPRCGSTKVRLEYPDIACLDCGYGGALIDFPVSWDWHRHFSIYYSGVDPGPCEPPKRIDEEVEERLARLENMMSELSSEDLRQLKLSRIYEEVKDIRRGLQQTQRVVARSSVRKKAERPRKPRLAEL